MKALSKVALGMGLTSLLGACVLLPAIVSRQVPAQALKPNEKRPLLRWAPPQLEKPIRLKVGQGYWSRNLKPDRDYLIELPKEKQVGGIALKGGRNVVLIGGHITVPPGATNQAQQRAIYIKDATGIVHIEGVSIDNSGGSEFDGVAVSAPEAIVQMENLRIVGLTGSQKTLHADVFQPWGGAKEIRIDHLTGTSNYQGFQIPPDGGPIGRTEIRNVNLGHITPPTGRPGFLLWLTTGSKTCNTYPISLQNVYVEPREGETVGRSIWPPVQPADSPSPTAACAAVEKEGVASWPNLPTVTGEVKQGVPPQGDFVPEDAVGTAYSSPGYEELNQAAN